MIKKRLEVTLCHFTFSVMVAILRVYSADISDCIYRKITKFTFEES